MHATRWCGWRVAAAAATALVAVADGRGQQVWVVDGNNGPGTHFTDLPPAVAAAQPGDVLVVRGAATYSGFATSKGLRVQGELAQSLQPVLTGELLLHDLPELEIFSFAHFELRGANVRLERAAGTVALVDLYTAPPTASVPASGPAALSADGCARVFVRLWSVSDGIDDGLAPVRFTDTQAILDGVQATGMWPSRQAPSPTLGPALDMQRSTLTLVDCTLVGGGASRTSCFTPLTPTPAATGAVSTLRVTGTSVIAGGVVQPSFSCQTQSKTAPAFGLTASTILVDPAAVILPPDPTIARLSIPWVTALPASAGSTATVRTHAPSGALTALFVGIAAGPVATPFGSWWLDPQTHVLADAGLVPSNGARLVSFPLAPVYPRGFAFAWQAAVLDGGAVKTTTPSVSVLQ